MGLEKGRLSAEIPLYDLAVRHIISKRCPDGRWKLDHANGNLRLEIPGQPSKIITFLSLRAMKRIGKS